MGRNKIAIKKIPNERNRQATFTKRKSGLIKKAMELSILCSCDVALIIFNSNDKLYQYSSMDMEAILLKYRTFKDSKQQLGNNDYVRLFGRESSRGKGHMSYYQDECYDSELDDVEEPVSFERKQPANDFNNYYPKRQSSITQIEDKNDAILRETPLRASRVTRSSANNSNLKAESSNQNGNAGINTNSNDTNFLYAPQYSNLPLRFDCPDEGGENSVQQPGLVNAALRLERSSIPSSGIRDHNGNQYIQFASRNSRNNSVYNQFHPAPNYMGFAYSPASLSCSPSRCPVSGFQLIPQPAQVPVPSQNLPLTSNDEKKKARRTLQKSGINLKIAIPDKARTSGMVPTLNPNSYTMPTILQTPTRPVQNTALFATSISPSSATASSRFEVFHVDNYYGFPGIVTGNILPDNISNLAKAIPVQNSIVSSTSYNNSNENMHVT